MDDLLMLEAGNPDEPNHLWLEPTTRLDPRHIKTQQQLRRRYFLLSFLHN